MAPLLGPIGGGLAALVSTAGSAVAAAAAGAGAASSSAALTTSLGVVLLQEKYNILVRELVVLLETTLGVATKKLDAAEAMLQLAIWFNIFPLLCFYENYEGV